MKIAIIGAGNVGRTLGLAWARRGHQVSFGVRDPGDKRAEEPLHTDQSVQVASNADAASWAEVVVLATPWVATREAVTSCGDLSGKIVIDCTNPLKPDFSGLVIGFQTSGAEQIALLANGAQVFKALNQIGANLMDSPQFPHGTPVMFVCGDGDQKSKVLDLVKQLGFDAVDAGGLMIARLLEPYAMLWMHLALVQGLGRDIGFALLRR
jgi:predicted dinucleotide-binding enzyme